MNNDLRKECEHLKDSITKEKTKNIELKDRREVEERKLKEEFEERIKDIDHAELSK